MWNLHNSDTHWTWTLERYNIIDCSGLFLSSPEPGPPEPALHFL
jgi:hypothetical protein